MPGGIMLSTYDFYYKKLETEEFSTDELKKMLLTLDKVKINDRINSKYKPFEIYLKMSENKNADDDLILQLVGKTLHLPNQESEVTYQILDNGSKKMFDDLWAEGPYQFTEKLWRSNHTDEEQLDVIYKDQFTGRPVPGIRVFRIFLQHPNLSDKILSKVTKAKNDADALAIAMNPNILSKPKTYAYICDRVREHSIFDGNSDDIVGAFLSNKGITWDKMADAIDLESQLKTVLNLGQSGSPQGTTSKRSQVILDFCRRKECPDNIRGYIYERTRDEDFLPQSAKDIFLF